MCFYSKRLRKFFRKAPFHRHSWDYCRANEFDAFFNANLCLPESLFVFFHQVILTCTMVEPAWNPCVFVNSDIGSGFECFWFYASCSSVIIYWVNVLPGKAEFRNQFYFCFGIGLWLHIVHTSFTAFASVCLDRVRKAVEHISVIFNQVQTIAKSA